MFNRYNLKHNTLINPTKLYFNKIYNSPVKLSYLMKSATKHFHVESHSVIKVGLYLTWYNVSREIFCLLVTLNTFMRM